MDEGVDLAVGLFPDLLAQREVAGDAVVIVELIGPYVRGSRLSRRAVSIMSRISFLVVKPPSLGTSVSSAPSAAI